MTYDVIPHVASDQVKPTARQSLRILMVCTRYLPEVGGTETHVQEVARRLSARGDFEITVLTTDRSRRLSRHETLDGITVLRVPSWPRKRDYYLAPAIAGVVNQRIWDLVHCQGIHTPVPLLAMFAARRAGIPYVVTFHTGGHSSRLRNALRSAQWRFAGPLLRNAASLIAVSNSEAIGLTRSARLADNPITVIRNGGTLPPPRIGTNSVPGRIISSGRLEQYKGHHRAIEALPHVMHEIPEAHLLILGDGPYERELHECARRLGISDRVSIKQISPNDRQGMATALAEACVVAALSDYEAHPVAVMEALSVGRPVVGYDIAGIGELITEGWVRGVPTGSSAALIAGELVKAMTSPPLASPAALPSWDSCAEQLAQVYLESLSSVPCSSPAGPTKRRMLEKAHRTDASEGGCHD
jgi:glycosyltransferase involved in cell wall biosynthesis